MSAPAAARILLPKLSALTQAANLLGAVVTFSYFRYIDPVAAMAHRPSLREIVWAVLAFGAIIAVGRLWGARLMRTLEDPTADPEWVRRRAVLLPYLFAGLTLVGWTIAGLVWGVVLPLAGGHFSPARSMRVFFGIAVIAGFVATAFVFFAVEHRWRRVLPAFFPEGDVAAVHGLLRFPVGTRLLVMFLLVGVVPLSVLGMFAYRRTHALLDADPGSAASMLADTGPVVVFFVVTGIVAAVGLSLLVSRSVARPLGQIERAMAEVA